MKNHMLQNSKERFSNFSAASFIEVWLLRYAQKLKNLIQRLKIFSQTSPVSDVLPVRVLSKLQRLLSINISQVFPKLKEMGSFLLLHWY